MIRNLKAKIDWISRKPIPDNHIYHPMVKVDDKYWSFSVKKQDDYYKVGFLVKHADRDPVKVGDVLDVYEGTNKVAECEIIELSE